MKPAWWPFSHRPSHYHQQYDGVLGTILEVQIAAGTPQQAQQAEQKLLAEIDRLEKIFSRYDPQSNLCLWLAGQQEPLTELAWILDKSAYWLQKTAGAYHPAAQMLSTLWAQDEPPTPQALASVLTQIDPATTLLALHQRQPILDLNFNALAKGHIADQAALVASHSPGVAQVLVNLGGDLCHRGSGTLEVAIANPLQPADNQPPLARLRIQNQGVATSGGTYRGFQHGQQRYSHLIDPRSGYPVDQVVGSSVLAPTCATADVLATAFSVLTPAQSLALANQLEGVGCLLVEASGQIWSNPFWQQHQL
jgi:thiamine biosynthesis lipoprotein